MYVYYEGSEYTMLVEKGEITLVGSVVSVYVNKYGFVFIHVQDHLYFAEFMAVDESIELIYEYDDILDADVLILNGVRVWTSQDDRFLVSKIDDISFSCLVGDGVFEFEKDLSLVDNINQVNKKITFVFDEYDPYAKFGGTGNTYRYLSLVGFEGLFDMEEATFVSADNIPSHQIYIGHLKALHGFSELNNGWWYYKSSSQKELDGTEYYLVYKAGTVYLMSMNSSDPIVLLRNGLVISTNKVTNLEKDRIQYDDIVDCSIDFFHNCYTEKVSDVSLAEYQCMCYLMRGSNSLQDCLEKARKVRCLYD